MIYLWEMGESYREKDMGEYDYDHSPDRFLLKRGLILSNENFSPTPIIHFEVPKKRLLKFDCLASNAMVPIVNNRVKQLLEKLAPNEVQFFPVKCICPDGELSGYHFINITHFIKGMDREKSRYKTMDNSDFIVWIDYLTYKPGCMGKYHLARDQENISQLLVSETVKTLFEKEKVTGAAWIVPPEVYYSGEPISQI